MLVAFVLGGHVLPRVAEFVLPALLHRIATSLRWIPGGWAAAAVVDATGGRPGVALLSLLALAGEDPHSDLLGRDLALAVLAVPVAAVPVAAVAAAVLAALFAGWSLLPAALLLAVATLLILLGVSNAAAVITPFPVPEDVSNPLAATSGSPGTGCLQGVFVLATLLTHGVLAFRSCWQ